MMNPSTTETAISLDIAPICQRLRVDLRAIPVLSAESIGHRLAASIIKRFGHTFRVDLQQAFHEASIQLGVREPIAEFHRYSELKHVWSKEGARYRFKVSDYLDDAPDYVLRSLAHYLLCRAHDIDDSHDRDGPYLEYSGSIRLWQKKRSEYLKRARHISVCHAGEHRDLGTVFRYVNAFYFSGRLPELTLAWSRESPRQRLGFFFEPLGLLAVNTVLDSERIPRYVLEFVVYHELLHYVNPADGARVRRIHHTAEFRRQERLFTHFDDSERWLRMLVQEHRRNKR